MFQSLVVVFCTLDPDGPAGSATLVPARYHVDTLCESVLKYYRNVSRGMPMRRPIQIQMNSRQTFKNLPITNKTPCEPLGTNHPHGKGSTPTKDLAKNCRCQQHGKTASLPHFFRSKPPPLAFIFFRLASKRNSHRTSVQAGQNRSIRSY